MSDNYLKVGKLYNLSSTTDVAIAGASLIHGLYNSSNTAVTVTIDGSYAIYVSNAVTFPNPIAFNTIKTSASTIVVLYS